MKALHWILVSLLMIALLGIPSWYALTGQGALAVPGSETQTIRSTNNRSVGGGGVRVGK